MNELDGDDDDVVEELLKWHAALNYLSLANLPSQSEARSFRKAWEKTKNVDWDCPYFGRTLTYDPITKKATLSKH